MSLLRALIIRHRGIEVVPEVPEEAPAPRPAPVAPAPAAETPVPPKAPCGYCEQPREGHGTRYSTFGGHHQWKPWYGPYSQTPGGRP